MTDMLKSAELNDCRAPARLIGDIMTTDLVCLPLHRPFREAVDLLAQNPIRHLLVTDPDGRLVGVISDRDVLRAEDGYDSESTLVADVMTPEPITVRATTLLSEAIAILLENRVNCLPVVDDMGRVHGIVTSTDMLGLLQNLQRGIENPPSH